MRTAISSARAGLAAAAAVLVCGITPALATNGYFAHGHGAVAKGMAGAGLTMGEGPTAVAQNPALGVAIGNVAGGEATVFMPDRDVTFSGAGPIPTGTYSSDNEAFLIPSGGVNYMVRDDTSVGLVMFGNGGMNTEFDANLFDFGTGVGSGPVGVDLMQAFVALNVSHQIAPGLSVGVAPVLAVQRFKATGLQAFGFFSTDPGSVSNRGYDWSIGGGAKAGLVWDINPWLSFGASAQSRMYMTSFEKYSGLFAEDGDFDIPPYISWGFGIKPMKGLSVMLEHQRIFYGSVDSIANRMRMPPNLGGDDGAGFGWKDMDVFRIGAEYEINPEWTVRGGFSHATDFTDGSQVMFNTLAPATIKNHASLGASWRMNERVALHFAYTHAFEAELTGRVPPAMGGQTETLRMNQHEVSLGLSYKF